MIVFIILFLPEGILGYLKVGQTSAQKVGVDEKLAPALSGGASDGHP